LYYIIFFKADHTILKATEVKEYPKVKDIVYTLKMLEKSDIADDVEINDLSMDIITKEQFKQI